MKRCLSLTLTVLAATNGISRGQILPAPVTFPGLFGPPAQLTVTPPPVAAGSPLELHLGGSATGSLGTYWNATATGGAVLGSNLVTELRLAESGAQISLTGTELKFQLANDSETILGSLGSGATLSLTWSATAVLDAPGNEFVLEPQTTYRLRFDVNAGDGLLNSALSISPTFGVELLNGSGAPVGTSSGGTVANLIGLQLETTAGAPAGTGTATVFFQTGASVPAGAAGIRFTGSASLPSSVSDIGTDFATVSNLSIGAVDAYTLWIEGSDLAPENYDPNADPDGDGRSNFDEFALATDPAVSDPSSIHVAIGDPDGPGTESSVLVMTLPVRSGATFTSDGGDQIASQDGVDYRVEGSFELLQWTLAISEVVENENFANPLPELSEGWEYRSFRVPGQTSDTPRAFLRVVTE